LCEDLKSAEVNRALTPGEFPYCDFTKLAPPDGRYYLVTVEEKCEHTGNPFSLEPERSAKCDSCNGTGTITRPELWKETDERLEVKQPVVVTWGQPLDPDWSHPMYEGILAVLIVRDDGSREHIMRSES
jgi:hypothetical protein